MKNSASNTFATPFDHGRKSMVCRTFLMKGFCVINIIDKTNIGIGTRNCLKLPKILEATGFF